MANARDRAMNKMLDDMLETCRLRGITSQHLINPVHKLIVGRTYRDSPQYDHECIRAANISAAGLTAQLCCLRTGWGTKRLRRYLENTGGVLDAIVRATSSSSEELEADTGRDNVDEHGDVKANLHQSQNPHSGLS